MTVSLPVLIGMLLGMGVICTLFTGLIISLRNVRKMESVKQTLIQMKARLESEQEKNLWLIRAEAKLREAFEALSSRALKNNSDQLMLRSKEQLESLLKVVKSDWGTQKQEMKGVVDPLSKGLEQLDKQIRTLEQKREGAYGGLERHLKDLQNAYTNLNNTTTDLKRALTSSGGVRGKWGEMQLKRIAEMAGMVEHIDFEQQVSVGSNSQFRPDMVVTLSGGGVMIVDAKAPMSAYLDAMQTDNEAERLSRLKDHAKAVRHHVQTLSKKEYWSQFEKTPEFVAMLIPYESGLSAAFESYPELFEEAMKNKVILVTPVTLLALLRVVAYGWMQLSLSENAKKIAAQGRELYSRFQKFNEHFQKIGSSLSITVNAYNRAISSLDSRLFPSARRLAELGEITDSILPAEPLDTLPKNSEITNISDNE